MKTDKTTSGDILKSASGKTCIELSQAIQNLEKMNVGQYTERIENYKAELFELQNSISKATAEKHKSVKHSEMRNYAAEVAAIMAFNSDKRFSITE